jgi:hypothetical protein
LEEAEAAEQAQTALSAARESGNLPVLRVEQALKRIRFAKKGLKPPAGKPPGRSLDRLAREFADFSSELADRGENPQGCHPVHNRRPFIRDGRSRASWGRRMGFSCPIANAMHAWPSA